MNRGKNWERNFIYRRNEVMKWLYRQSASLEVQCDRAERVMQPGRLVAYLQNRVHRLRMKNKQLRQKNLEYRQDNEVLLENLRKAYDVLAQGQDVRETIGLLIGDLEVNFNERTDRYSR